MSKITPIARKSEIVVQDLGNELLIYDLKANKALSLNQTSALIWQLSNGEKTIDEIAVETSKKLNAKVTDEFVWLALWRLKKENLIETEISNIYGNSTRREVIKKVGFASMVALPVISSVIAPTAIYAASGNNCSGIADAPGCSCTSETTCQSVCCGGVVPPICVPFRASSIGTACRNACECVTNLCGFGRLCAADASVPDGGPCRSNRECISRYCGGPLGVSGGTCTPPQFVPPGI
jgi:hypothetical protein